MVACPPHQVGLDTQANMLRTAAVSQRLATTLAEYRSSKSRFRDLERRVQDIKQRRRDQLMHASGHKDHVMQNKWLVDSGYYRPSEAALRL